MSPSKGATEVNISRRPFHEATAIADHEVQKNPRVKILKATVKKENHDFIKAAPLKMYYQKIMWKKDHNDPKKHPAVKMNKVIGKKADNQAEDKKRKTKKRTMTPSGGAWRIWRMSLTC